MVANETHRRPAAHRRCVKERAQADGARVVVCVVPRTPPAAGQRDLRRRRLRRRPGPHRPRARGSCARRASRSSARSATPIPSPRRWTRSPSAAPTRSSSRRCRRRPRAGCGATSSSASATRRGLPGRPRRHRPRRRGPAVRGHARRREPHGGARRAARAPEGEGAAVRSATCSSSSCRWRAASASRRRGARAPRPAARPRALAGPAGRGHDRRPRPVRRDDERAAVLPRRRRS